MEIKKLSSAHLPTDCGPFTLHLYSSHDIALVRGTLSEGALVRLHSECLTGDLFTSRRCDCGNQLRSSMEMIAKEESGVILYMRSHEGRGIGLENKIRAYSLQEQGHDTVEANQLLGFESDLREYKIAAEILQDLGLAKIRLLTNNPAKICALKTFGIEIIERIALPICFTEENRHYLRTKKEKLGHLL